jgi:predicted metalloprotease with PDZ domain
VVLEYRIDVLHPASREIGIQLTIRTEDMGGRSGSGGDSLDLFLPTWTPGSYLQREFARHLSRVAAADADSGAPLRCRKVSKNRFRILLAANTRQVRVSYGVYAHELSVRTADLTADHAFWNHACLLLWPVDQLELRARLHVVFPRTWQLACALPRDEHSAPSGVGELCKMVEPGEVGDAATAARDSRSVVLLARGMDEVCDSPCLLGNFHRVEWVVRGVPHAIALDGLDAIPVPPSLSKDLAAIVEAAAAVFGGPLPYSSYEILTMFTADGHGGLEHAASTTLLVSRTSFSTPKGYREFLSLVAHELFHAWNVKRLRPVEFWHYDYEAENYTDFLWLIEGWTAYYDDLLCARAALMSRSDYLGIVAKNVNAMLAAPGRLRLSLEESSFDAWIRLYRPDENTRNSSQNYYGNGAVAAMCLDLVIRRDSRGQRSLDHVLAQLYESTFANGRGYDRDDVRRVLTAVGGESAVQVLAELVTDSLDPPLESLLSTFGLRVQWRDTDRPFVGVQFESGNTVIASVIAGSPAHAAGLHPGDEILALQNLRVDASRWADVLAALAKVGAPVAALIARRGIVKTCKLQLRNAPGTMAIEVDTAASPEARALLDAWLPADKVATTESNPERVAASN